MKILCFKNEFKAAVAAASRFTASRSPNAALEGLLIETVEDTIRVTGYDLKRSLQIPIQGNVYEPGAIVIDARFMNDVMKAVAGDSVTISTEGKQVVLQSGEAVFDVVGFLAEDYPELPIVEKEKEVKVPEDLMCQMLREADFAISDNETRPVYTGMLFDIHDNRLNVVACDGFRMAIRREAVQSTMEDCSFIVPAYAVSELERICSATGTNEVAISVGKKHIMAAINGSTLITRRIEGEFLDYEKSLPKTFIATVVVDRKELQQSLSRVAIIRSMSAKENVPTVLEVGDGIMSLSIRTATSSANDKLIVTNTGEPLTIGVNCDYMLDAIKAIQDEKVKISFSGVTGPMVISPEKPPEDGEADKFSYMVLPVLLKANY